MNEQKLQQIIIKAAKQIPPDDSVPFAFEKRIMRRIRQVAEVDVLGLWSRMLWRAALPCVLVMALTGAWASLQGQQAAADGELPDLEYAVLVPVEVPSEDNW